MIYIPTGDVVVKVPTVIHLGISLDPNDTPTVGHTKRRPLFVFVFVFAFGIGIGIGIVHAHMCVWHVYVLVVQCHKNKNCR